MHIGDEMGNKEGALIVEVGRLKDQIADLLDERQDLYAQIDKATPEGFVLVEASEFESLKSDNKHFTESCIDWTDRAYKQRAKVEFIKNEVERFKQSGTDLDLGKFLDNLIEFSTFKHDEEFEDFVLVRKELPEEIAESMALERVEKPVTETDPTWIKISEDAYKGRIQSKKWELWRDYKAMIEAQEQSHDSN